MVFDFNADLSKKLHILSDAAKYDVACTSSGVSRNGKQGSLGTASAAGICHSFSADGRCISLLKILFTNECIYNCKYCINRVSNNILRASFTPEEVCTLTIEFYKRNYIEGLFLSSGIIQSPDYTMELITETLKKLRVTYGFNGYIHCKAIPGASYELVEKAGWYADRMSVNLEFPTEAGLKSLAPNKTRKTILTPMRQIQAGMAESMEVLGMKGGNRSAYWHTQKRLGNPLPGDSFKTNNIVDSGFTTNSHKNVNINDHSFSTNSHKNSNINDHNFSTNSHKNSNINDHNFSTNSHKNDNINDNNFSISNPNNTIDNNFSINKSKNNINRQSSLQVDNFADSNQLQYNSKSTALTQWHRYDTSRGFVPAGQSTQMIIGATGESDYEILTVTEALYQRFDLKRVFFSAFINVNNDSSLVINDGQPPLRREHRLYQADWLLRYYGFSAEELLSEKRPFFNTYLDPKCDWALGHMEHFPIEINKADYNTLLRVPGIGVKSAGRIVAARRAGSLDFKSLKAMGVVLKRAVYFITCNGHMMYNFLKVDEDYITRSLMSDNVDIKNGFDEKVTYKQLTLFDAGL